MDGNDCDLCGRLAAEGEPPGGWVLRTGRWSAYVADGFEAPGWFFLALDRHAEGPMALDDDEAAEMGPVIRRLTAAVESVTGATRVYLTAYGELYPHFHVLVAPRLAGQPPELRGPGLFTHRHDLIDADGAAEVAARVRQALDA